MPRRSYTPSIWRGAIAGAVAGLAGSWAHEQAQVLLSHTTGDGVDAAQRATGRPHEWDARSQDQLSGQSDPATVHAANSVATAVGAGPLPEHAHDEAGPLVHYAFGVGVGAVYGALAERWPAVTAGAGIPFGLAVYAVADQTAMPAFGWSVPGWRRPARAHAYSLASHVAYGALLEATRVLIRGSRR